MKITNQLGLYPSSDRSLSMTAARHYVSSLTSQQKQWIVIGCLAAAILSIVYIASRIYSNGQASSHKPFQPGPIKPVPKDSVHVKLNETIHATDSNQTFTKALSLSPKPPSPKPLPSKPLSPVPLSPKINPTNSAKPITIIDAKDSGLEWLKVKIIISKIANKELKGQRFWSASSFIQEDYFNGIPIALGLSSPETILLAKVADDIVGFIITSKKESWPPLPPGAADADSCFIEHLVVDSSTQRLDVAAKLMLASMRKTKELGKRYLSLEYVAEGLGVDKHIGDGRREFYKSFTTKFGVPMKECGKVEVGLQLFVHPYYDLQDIDFASITHLMDHGSYPLINPKYLNCNRLE